MRGTIVLDASAAAAVVFREPGAVDVAGPLLRARRVLVPSLFHLELANVGRTKVLRGETDRRRALVLLRAAGAWPVEVADAPWLRALTIALRRRLTVYDAVYLGLAISHRCRLLTLDRQLARAAGRRSLIRA